VQEARALPSSPENLPAKIAATLSVAQNAQQPYLALGTETPTPVEELIALPVPETAEQADENLNIAQSVLLSISSDAQAFSRTGSFVLRGKPAALEQVKRDLAIVSECVAYHARFTKEALDEQFALISQMREMSTTAVRMLQQATDGTSRSMEDLMAAMDERRVQREITEVALRKQKEIDEDLQLQLRSTSAALTSLDSENPRRGSDRNSESGQFERCHRSSS
jgi:hypothetical protein